MISVRLKNIFFFENHNDNYTTTCSDYSTSYNDHYGQHGKYLDT